MPPIIGTLPVVSLLSLLSIVLVLVVSIVLSLLHVAIVSITLVLVVANDHEFRVPALSSQVQKFTDDSVPSCLPNIIGTPKRELICKSTKWYCPSMPTLTLPQRFSITLPPPLGVCYAYCLGLYSLFLPLCLVFGLSFVGAAKAEGRVIHQSSGNMMSM